VGPAGSGAYAEQIPHFAGFTTTTYSGNIGGLVAAHAICAAAFPGAHLCHTSEFIGSLGQTGTPVPATGAWMDMSISPTGYTSHLYGAPSWGRYTGFYSCNEWTTTGTGTQGTYVGADGGMNNNSGCGAVRALACCDTVAKVQVVGYTTANATFSAVGRPAMHAACAAEFSGSHMCHVAEYLNAGSSLTVPANGAWIEPSADYSGTSYTAGAAPGMARYAGTFNSCNNWTTTASNNATYVLPNGSVASNSSCAAARHIVCCM
jgi:hypothetical protein